jgi:hypothetical protein
MLIIKKALEIQELFFIHIILYQLLVTSGFK